MRNKILRYLTTFLFLLGTLNLAAPQAKAATPGYGFLTFGCAQGPQNGFIVPATPANFAGCTITVYNHATSVLTATYNSSTGTTMTNPVALTPGTGTVTTSGTTVTYVSGTAFVTTGAWVGQPIVINGVQYTISAVGSSSSITTSQSLPTIASATAYSVTPLSEVVYLQDGWYDVCVSNATSTPILQGSCNYGIAVNSDSFAANKAQLATAFTDANASGLQAITGLSFAIPSTFVGSLAFHCGLGYSEATPAAGAGFGVAVLTTAPTRLDAVATTYSSAAGASTNGPVTNLTTTTPTAFSTVTPGSTVVYPVYIDGTVQTAGGGAQTLQFYVQQGTAADVIVVAAGSYCTLF